MFATTAKRQYIVPFFGQRATYFCLNKSCFPFLKFALVLFEILFCRLNLSLTLLYFLICTFRGLVSAGVALRLIVCLGSFCRDLLVGFLNFILPVGEDLMKCY